MRLRITTAPAPSTPCTWNTDFAISRPIVLTSPMDGSPQCGLLRQNHPMALLMPQSGRRPQHQKLTLRSVWLMSALPPKSGHLAYRFNELPELDRHFRAGAVLIVSVTPTLRRTTARAMHPADFPAPHRRSTTPLTGPL